MNISKRYGFGVPRAFAAIGLMMVVGCGDDSGLAKRYSVTGTVKYKGEPVPKGTITFTPAETGGRAAAGDIQNGKYSLSTTGVANDGALPGRYRVTVTGVEVDTAEMKAIAKGGQFHHDEVFAKSVKAAKKLVPSKYNLADTSDLSAEVKPQSNTFDFDLKD